MSKRNYDFIEEVGNLGKKVTHIPKNQLLLADQGARDFKGEFHGCIYGGGVLHAEWQIRSNNHFEVSHAAV